MVLCVLGIAFGLVPLIGSIFKIAFGLSGGICGLISLCSPSNKGAERDNLVFATTIVSFIVFAWGIASLVGTLSILGGLGNIAGDALSSLREWLTTL